MVIVAAGGLTAYNLWENSDSEFGIHWVSFLTPVLIVGVIVLARDGTRPWSPGAP